MLSELRVYRVAAVCSLVFAAVMLLQEWLFRLIPTATTREHAFAIEISPINRAHAWTVFLSFFCVVVAYSAIAAKRFERSPALSGLGGVFCFLFTLVELLYRSIELFAVNGRWIPKYLGETDVETKALLGAQIGAFGDIVFALYFVLLSAHLIGSVAYSMVTWSGKGMERLVSILFAINGSRLLLRLIGGYAGQAWLEGINRAIYSPIVVILFVVVGVWLWRDEYGDGSRAERTA